jgi:hypothetical protein
VTKPSLTQRVSKLEADLEATLGPRAIGPNETVVDMAELDPYWEAKQVAERSLDNERREACREVLDVLQDELAKPTISTLRVANLAIAYKNLAYPTY